MYFYILWKRWLRVFNKDENRKKNRNLCRGLYCLQFYNIPLNNIFYFLALNEGLWKFNYYIYINIDQPVYIVYEWGKCAFKKLMVIWKFFLIINNELRYLNIKTTRILRTVIFLLWHFWQIKDIWVMTSQFDPNLKILQDPDPSIFRKVYPKTFTIY